MMLLLLFNIKLFPDHKLEVEMLSAALAFFFKKKTKKQLWQFLFIFVQISLTRGHNTFQSALSIVAPSCFHAGVGNLAQDRKTLLLFLFNTSLGHYSLTPPQRLAP